MESIRNRGMEILAIAVGAGVISIETADEIIVTIDTLANDMPGVDEDIITKMSDALETLEKLDKARRKS